MGELSQIRNVLEEIKNFEHVMDVSLISRGGMYISGDPPRGVHQETFAAMSAIILGAAETTSAELKDNLAKVVLQLSGRNLILTGAGPRYLLAVATDAEADVNRISEGKDLQGGDHPLIMSFGILSWPIPICTLTRSGAIPRRIATIPPP